MYYDGHVVSTSQGILFQYLNGLKFIKIGEEMSIGILRKAIMDAIGGERSLFEFQKTMKWRRYFSSFQSLVLNDQSSCIQ